MGLRGQPTTSFSPQGSGKASVHSVEAHRYRLVDAGRCDFACYIVAKLRRRHGIFRAGPRVQWSWSLPVWCRGAEGVVDLPPRPPTSTPLQAGADRMASLGRYALSKALSAMVGTDMALSQSHDHDWW